MIIMNKLEKRLSKAVKNPENAIVLGTGIDSLPEFLKVFRTVFLFSFDPQPLKARNLVYRENFNSPDIVTDVSVIFVDLNHLSYLEKLVPVWQRWRPTILIEGNEPIDRSKSKLLYDHGYRCVDQQGFFHTWKLQT